MAHISLTDSQRQELQHLARRGRDARVVRWAQGLLWLDQGEHPMAVAQRLGVTLESVYAWVRRLQHQGARSLVEKLIPETSETCEGPVARLEHRAIPGLGFAPPGQEEPETGQGVGDRATLVAGGLSGTEPSGRAMEAAEGDRPGQSAHPLDGGVDGTSLWKHPIPFSGGAFAAGRSLVR
jgi:hypothetical protein